jgi:hypothetical protein
MHPPFSFLFCSDHCDYNCRLVFIILFLFTLVQLWVYLFPRGSLSLSSHKWWKDIRPSAHSLSLNYWNPTSFHHLLVILWPSLYSTPPPFVYLGLTSDPHLHLHFSLLFGMSWGLVLRASKISNQQSYWFLSSSKAKGSSFTVQISASFFSCLHSFILNFFFQ